MPSLSYVGSVKFLNIIRGVSNPGMEYELEQWNGKWNGMVNVHSYN